MQNNSESETLRREKEVLENELRVQQELIAKLQQQQHQNGIINRSNKTDEVTLHQKEALEKKLSSYIHIFIFSPNKFVILSST